MSQALKASDNEPLAVVAGKIACHAKKSDEHVIAAAMLIREARRRIEAGEAGDVTWYEWAPKNIDLAQSRLRDLQQIADAEDPEKELERLRRLTRKRVGKHRKKKAAERQALEEDRKQLIGWAKKAPIAEVRHMLDTISGELCIRPGQTSSSPHPAVLRHPSFRVATTQFDKPYTHDGLGD